MDLALATSTPVLESSPIATTSISMENYGQAQARPGVAFRTARAGAVVLIGYILFRAVKATCGAIASTNVYQNVSERLSTKQALREELGEQRLANNNLELELKDATALYSKLEEENATLRTKFNKTVAPAAKAVLEAAKIPAESLL